MTDQPAPAPTRRRANTRARILDAAAAVFAQKGLNGATVDDLMSAAGYTRGAFYSNFSTKEDVFYALYEKQSALMVGLVRDSLQTGGPDEFDLGSVGAILEALRPHARIWYLLQTEAQLHAMRTPESGARFQEQSAGFESEIAEILVDVLGRLGRRPTISSVQLADVLTSLYIRGLAREALAGDAAPTGSAFVEATLPAVLLGLSTPLVDPGSHRS
ncbi:TetR/AcrR family transcriptional regulator [Actinotalea sp. C106]|uniref:TetR/AcrR family transcriptional regulator n=1 Tax=Actinotalea sp. C106 TaxID=2908644 RepID=UPI002027E656|nr:TetR/AcrR family transcriptional regulator [Actinotalea sp. C106]